MNNRCRALPVVLIALITLAQPLLAHSPEHPVGTTVVGPAPHGRGPAAMATDGTDFFVVWSDQRAETRDSLVGTRVTRGGQVLDPLGIRLTMLNIGVQHVNVVWDGGAYLVTWTSGWADANVYAARVDREGRIVMEPRVIAAEAMAMSGRYSASNGNVTVVAYLSLDRNAGSNRVVVLDREGNTLHHETIIGTAQPYMSGVSVAATGSRFVVVWSAFLNNQIQTATVQAVALNAAGHLEKGPTPIGTGDGPMIATDGSRFLVVSQHWTEPKWQLLARTVDASLTEITPVQTLTNGYSIDAPSLLWRGNRYEIIAGRHENPGEGSHVFSIEVAADGKKLAERSLGSITTGYDSAFPVAATNGSDLMVAFTKRLSPADWNGRQVFGRIYPTNTLTPKPDQLLTWSGNAHNNPDVTSSAAGHFVAWQESDGVYATRIDANGLSLDGRGIQLSDGSWRPRLAFNGTHYVVAWLQWYSIGVRWVEPATGEIVASVEIPTLWTNTFAMTASAEATYLAYIGDEDQRLKVMRIPHTTHVPDAVPVVVSPEDMLVDMPALSWNGSTLLVAWNEIFVPRGDPPFMLAVKIHAARVSAGLTLLDPAPLLIAGVDLNTAFTSTFGTPSVASNGADWLVVTDSNANILARRVLSNGTVEGSVPVKLANGFSPVAAFDGTLYAVSWKAGPASWPPDATIMLAAVPASSTLNATARTVVSTHVTADAPAIAPTATGAIAVVYTKLSFAPEHIGVERSYVRIMDSHTTRGRVVRR